MSDTPVSRLLEDYPVTIFRYECKCIRGFSGYDHKIFEGYHSLQDRVTTSTIDEMTSRVQSKVQKATTGRLCDCSITNVKQLFNHHLNNFKQEKN